MTVDRTWRHGQCISIFSMLVFMVQNGVERGGTCQPVPRHGCGSRPKREGNEESEQPLLLSHSESGPAPDDGGKEDGEKAKLDAQQYEISAEIRTGGREG